MLSNPLSSTTLVFEIDDDDILHSMAYLDIGKRSGGGGIYYVGLCEMRKYNITSCRHIIIGDSNV